MMAPKLRHLRVERGILAATLAVTIFAAPLSAQMDAATWSKARKLAIQEFQAGLEGWTPGLVKGVDREYQRRETLRQDAIARIQDADRKESVALLCEFVRLEFADATNVKSPKVIEALSAALSAHRDEKAVALLTERAERETSLELRMFFTRAVGQSASQAPIVADHLKAAFSDRSLPVRIIATGQVGARHMTTLKDALIERLRTPIFAMQWAALDSLEQLVERRDVFALIDALPHSQGRVGERLRALLKKLTGGDFAQDAASWKLWWTSKLKTEAQGGGQNLVESPTYGAPQEPRYYGMSVQSRRVVFVIDSSGSMIEPVTAETADKYRVPITQPGPRGSAPVTLPERPSRIDLAKAELIRAVWDLPEDTWFNIVLYNSGATRWKPLLIEANAKNRAEAVEFVQKLGAGGATNIWAGLIQGITVEPADRTLQKLAEKDVQHPVHYELGPDTLYFLTDGEPMLSKFVSGQEHAAAFYVINQARKVQVNTIGIGADADATLLKLVAEATGGSYHDAGK